MYGDDNDTKFPTLGLHFPLYEYGGGDPNRTVPMAALMLAATNRPLSLYTQCRDVFKCPADRGYDHRPYQPWHSKNQFADYGTSYRYNYNPWTKTRVLRLRQRCRELLREQIAQTVSSVTEVEQEYLALQEALSC